MGFKYSAAVLWFPVFLIQILMKLFDKYICHYIKLDLNLFFGLILFLFQLWPWF